MQNNTTGAVMPKRTKLMDKACHKINGFSSLCQDLDKSNEIYGMSQSTSDNYRHHLAHIALFYDRNPLELTDQEATDYLYMLIKKEKYSMTFFRFVVFGMRAACKFRGLPYDQFKLTSIHNKKKLPVVLNSKEMRALVEAMPFPLKDCLVLMLFMDTGLRLSCNSLMHVISKFKKVA
jgi:site-specific recombinase XerD